MRRLRIALRMGGVLSLTTGRRIFWGMAGAGVALWISGCVIAMPRERRHAAAEIRIPVVNEAQSLHSIGEQALTAAEDLEAAERFDEAKVMYGRALWALRYHRRLTGEEPLLLGAAEEGMERLAAEAPGREHKTDEGEPVTKKNDTEPAPASETQVKGKPAISVPSVEEYQ